MKKTILKGNMRLGLLLGLSLLLLGALAGLFWSYARPAKTAVEYTARPYTYESTVDYRVRLQPNKLYDQRHLGPDRAYLSALTDSLGTEFTFHFTAEEETELKGEYSVSALIIARSGSENHPVWEKSFLLLPPKPFAVSGTEVLVQESVAIPFSQYAALAKSIVEETNYSPQSLTLEVLYSATVEADTPEGQLRETVAPKLIVPLRETVFTVEGELESKGSGGIAATRLEPVPYHAEARWGFALLSAVLAFVLLLCSQMTAAEKKPGAAQRRLARILKQHRERIVECAGKVSLSGHNLLAVATFEDLLKIADELEKPVFYHRDGGENRGHSFFIFSGQRAYCYNLGEIGQPVQRTPRRYPPRQASR